VRSLYSLQETFPASPHLYYTDFSNEKGPLTEVMIAPFENEFIPPSILSIAQVHFPAIVEYFKGFFTG